MKDGKIFGKINIIDLFLIIALVAGAIYGVNTLRASDGGIVTLVGPDPSREFNISFYTEEVEGFTANAINIGDNVFDNGRNIAMGVVTDLDIRDAIIWNADQNGIAVSSPKTGFNSIEIHARLTAVPSENGILIAGNRYGIGHSLAVRAGSSIIFMRISGLEEIA
jgi:hypothetical protein